MTSHVQIPDYQVHDSVTLDPERSALLVIDMQNDFVRDGGSLQVPDAETTVPRIRELLELARKSGMRVVFSQDTHEEGDPEWDIWPEHARAGTWGWEIVEELTPAENEVVLQKVRYAFYGTHLEAAASAALRWYVVIPWDATSALEPFDLEASLRQTAFLFAGKIATVDALEPEGSG